MSHVVADRHVGGSVVTTTGSELCAKCEAAPLAA
jgi:hypothetical protein